MLYAVVVLVFEMAPQDASWSPPLAFIRIRLGHGGDAEKIPSHAIPTGPWGVP